MTFEFVVDVKRKKDQNGNDVWSAQTNGVKFTGDTEESIREQVRVYLLQEVSQKTNKHVDTLEAKLTRTWRVRINNVEAEENDEFIGYSLFD